MRLRLLPGPFRGFSLFDPFGRFGEWVEGRAVVIKSLPRRAQPRTALTGPLISREENLWPQCLRAVPGGRERTGST